VKKANLTSEMRDQILLMHQKEITGKQIADILGISQPSVVATMTAYKAAKAKDMDALRRMRAQSQGGAAKWACEKFGLNLDKEEKPKEEPQRQETADMADIEAAIHVAIGKVLLRMDAQEKRMEQMSNLMQSLANGIIKGANVNSDLLYQEMKKQTELLAGVKSNTRPRYDNRVQ